jgi:hypothetical protein
MWLIDVSGTGVAPLFSPVQVLHPLRGHVLHLRGRLHVPLIVVFLELAGVVPSATWRRWRRPAIVVICLVAAVITPSSDPFSFTAMAVPMLVFYECRSSSAGSSTSSRGGSGPLRSPARVRAGRVPTTGPRRPRRRWQRGRGGADRIGQDGGRPIRRGPGLDAGGKAFYTTPLKALSNQKYWELVRRHGPESVGLLTGDNSINGNAPVVVMTTEVLRNMIYASSATLEGLRYVVLDEVHYLQNAYRGPVWEEVIIHAPPGVDLVCLSATVSNAEELADWIRTVRGETTAVIEDRRPVALHDLYLLGDKGSERLLLLPTLVDGAQPGGSRPRLQDPPASGDARPAPRPSLYPPAGRGAGAAGGARHAPGDLFHLQPGRVRRRRGPVRREGKRLTSSEERRQIRAIAEDTWRRSRRGPGGPGLRQLVVRAGSGLRGPPRRPGAAVQGGGGGLLRGRAGQGGVRHRDPVARDQHARPVRGDREADQVHRRTPRVPDPRRVHPAHRPGRPSGHRRGRLRGRPVVAVRALRPGGRAGRRPQLRPDQQLPPDLQHGRQPGAPVPARRGPPPAQPVVRPVPGRQRRRPPGRPTGAQAPPWPKPAPPRPASAATSRSTAACSGPARSRPASARP